MRRMGTRQRRVAALALVAASLVTFGTSPRGAAGTAPVTIYVVRHAEAHAASSDAPDPPLTETGMARAAALADLLVGEPLVAVYSTPYRRTSMTAGPAAGAARLKLTRYAPRKSAADGGLPDRATLLDAHAGRTVLVVGHSNTVPEIVTALGGDGGEQIAHDDHADLFVLTLDGDETVARTHRYGALRGDRREVIGVGAGTTNVSGVVVSGTRVLICDDEGRAIESWRRKDAVFARMGVQRLPVEDDDVSELDLEGLAAGGGYVYAVGSHSLRRKKAREREPSGKPETYADNRKRLTRVGTGADDARDCLYRIPVDETGALRTKDAVQIDLRELLTADPFLGAATAVPSKENGLDIEGLAGDGDELLLGLRGPVLRGNLTPVVRIRLDAAFSRVVEHRVVFVDLAGRGIRGLTRCGSGFLVLTGAVGGRTDRAHLVHWDGEDMLPGVRGDRDASRRVGRTTLLGTLPPTSGSTPEGVSLIEESADAYEILVVHDGAPDGAPTTYRVRKPRGH